jgi:tetratricopeptide (TPR) repeat protein
VFHALALLGVLLSPVAALAGDRRAFLEELAAVEQREEVGDFAAAKARLVELVRGHEGETYVIAEVERIQDLLASCTFADEYGEPSLEDLLRGEIVERDKDGDVHLRLRFATASPGDPSGTSGAATGAGPPELVGLPNAPGDIVWEADRSWYPVPFGGPGTLRLRGRVPEPDSSESPETTLYAKLSLGVPGASCTTFEVACGPPATDGLPVVRARIEGERPKELVGKTGGSPLLPGAEYELELRVSERRLFLKDHGKTLLYTPRPKDVYGRFGWVDLPGLEELELVGEPDAGWLAELPARHRAAAFERWSSTEPDVGMPAWVRDWLASKGPLITVAESQFYDRVEALLEDDPEGALALIESAGEGEYVPWYSHYYASIALSKLKRYAETVAHLDALLELTPRHAGSLEGRESILRHLGVGRLSELFRDGSYEEGLALLQSPETAQIDPFNRHWFAHLYHDKLGDRESAYVAIDAALELRPDFAPALVRRGRMHWSRGWWQSALDDMRRATESDPSKANHLATYLRLVGRLEEAKDTVRAALDDGQSGPRWTALNAMIERAQRGPELPGARRYEGRDCVVISRLPERDCRAAVVTFDETREMVASLIGSVPEGEEIQERIPVFLFHSPDKFERYRANVLESTSDSVWGIHSSTYWQVVVQWRLPLESLHTVRHEAVHNYLTRRFANTPSWMHEGLACYVEHAEMIDGRFGIRSEPRKWLWRLIPLAKDDAEWMPYSDLLTADSMSDGGAMQRYAQSLALVEYLLNTSEENITLWGAVVEALQEGGGTQAAADVLMGAVPDLDDRVRERVRSLGLR